MMWRSVFRARGPLPGARAVCAVGLAALAAGAGCQRDREVDGVDQYSLERTTLGDAPGVCSADGEVTWCHSNPSVAIGEQAASVDLYFRGEDAEAPLVEILLAIDACRPGEVEHVMREELGDPDASRGSRLRWDGEYATVFVELDSEYGGCSAHFVDPEDEERVAELDEGAGAEGAGSPAEDAPQGEAGQ